MFNTEQYKDLIPPALLEGLVAWGKKQHEVGGFLTALLSNDLREAVMRADSQSLAALRDLVQFAYWELPSGCHGSAAKVAAWAELINKSKELESQSND